MPSPLRDPIVALLVVLGCVAWTTDPASAGPEAPDEPSIVPRILLEPASRIVLRRDVELRKVYEKAIALTASMEGFRRTLYDDPAGFCTIGHGHLVKRDRCDGSEPAHFQDGVSEDEGLELLREDMSLAERAVTALVSVELTDGQYGALCDFAFNVGRGLFARSTLLERVNEGAFASVPAQLRRYVVAGGRRLRGLEIRREREIELFFEGSVVPRSAPRPDEDLTPIDILSDLPSD